MDTNISIKAGWNRPKLMLIKKTCSTKWITLIFEEKIAAVIFCVDGWQNRLDLGTFNFKVRFLRMDINRKISRTGHPIKLIF